MKFPFFVVCLLIAVALDSRAQNTLDGAGLTAATPAQVAFSLRKLSSAYTGFAVKVRRSSDNAEANVAFDASGNTSASSMVTFTPNVTVGVGFGIVQAGTVTSSVAKTGTVTITVNKPGTISVTNTSSTVTGTGTSFTTDCAVGASLFTTSNTFLGVVSSITNNTSLQITNNSTQVASAATYKTATSVVTGTGTNFIAELAIGDRIFNSSNVYLGTVATITSATSMTLNSVDAVSATTTVFKGTSASISGTGTNFTALSPGDLLVSNNVTLGIILTITSATALTLETKAGGCVSALTYKTNPGTVSFSSFYSGTSVYLNTWYDQSGFNRHATQLKTVNQARIVNAGTLYIVNARTSIEFSAALTSFVQTSSAASYLNNTLYTLNKVTAEATINPTLSLPISTTGGSGPGNTISHYGYRSSSLFTVAQYGNDQNFNATPSTTLELHTSVKTSTASSQFYKNGISLGVQTSGIPSNLNNVGLLNIGFYTPTVSYYSGSISELAVFSIALGSADLSLLNNNQLLYYSIASTSWTGAISSAWTDPGNWSTGVVPSITDPAIVVIPAGKPNYPVISTVAPANSISLEAGTSLVITGTLQLAGTLNSLGTCTATSGTVQFVGLAPQSITNGTYSGNTIQNIIVNNSTGLLMASNFTVSGNLTFTTGFLSIGAFNMTLGGGVVNSVPGGLRGGSTSNLIVNGALSRTLSFDQSTVGNTNVLNNLTLNTSGLTTTLANNLLLSNAGSLTFTTGKLAIANTTLTLRGLVVNTVTGGLSGNAGSNLIIDGAVNPTLSFDQTSIGTTNVLNNLTLNCTGHVVSLSNPLTVNSTLNLTAGTLLDNGNQLTSAGTLNLVAGTFKLGSVTVATTWPLFSVNNISAGGTVEYASGVSQIVSGTPIYQNLTISATAGAVAAGNITVNNVLNLAVANPSATVGSFTLGTFTLNMGAAATTIGAGDVTGITKRTTILANTTYTMGNQFVSITFPNFGTLPTQISMKTTIGVGPSWRPTAVLRTYDFIQSGGSGTKAVITAHYLDNELNGNVETKLVDYSFRTSGSILTEHGKSNFNTTQNWITLSNVDVAFFTSTFGNVELSFDASTLTTLTWNGSTSTSWITATNWTPNGGPSTNTNLIIPDATTTPNDPSMPATASNGSLSILAGGIVNADPGAQLVLNNSGLAWSNSGTFNAGNSTIIFSNVNGTVDGITNFNNVIISAGASLQMGTDNIMRIAGTITNSGTFTTDLLQNTVEYNGNNQTVIIPNGSTGAYYNLIISGTGTTVLPAASLNVVGDFTVNGPIAVSGSTIAMQGAGPQFINGTSSFGLNNLTINNSGSGVTMTQGVNVTGALTFSSGKLNIGNNTLTISGTVVNNIGNGITGSVLSNLVFNGSANATVSFDQANPGVSNALNNLTINSSGKTLTMGSDLETNGNLQFTAGKLFIGANTLTIKNTLTNLVSGGFTGSSGSNLILTGGVTSPAISFDQTTPGTTNVLNNFTINSTAQTATLSNPVIIGGTLNLTDGIILTSTVNSLTMSAGATYTGGSDISFISGPLNRNTATTGSYNFPVGKGVIYAPASVTPSTVLPGTYSTEFFPATPPAGTLAATITAIAIDEYWNINKISGPDAGITLLYQANNSWSLGSPSGADGVVVAGLVGGVWTPENGDMTSGGIAAPLASSLQTSFGSFTFAYGQSALLPLTLLSFTANRADPAVQLNWTTAGEFNVSYFEILHSQNGIVFSVAGVTKGTNSPKNTEYHWKDLHPDAGSNYYRLKILDIDGAFNYSKIIKIDLGDHERKFVLYPNPVVGHELNILMIGQPKGKYIFNLYTAAGVKTMEQEVLHDGHNGTKVIRVSPSLRAGVYYLDVVGEDKHHTSIKIYFNK